MRRTRIRSAALMLAGIGMGVGLSGALAGRTALARDHEYEHDHNPRIHQALSALHDAQAELDVANTDFHGHKREAQGAVQHAIDELDRIKDW